MGKRRRRKSQGINFDDGKFCRRKLDRRKLLKGIRNWFLAIFITVILGYGFSTFIIQSIHVVGPSMEGTLKNGDIVLVNKAAYVFSDIERYDIVALKLMDDDGYFDIKRVIALPGETIQIIGGSVFVDGEEIDGLPYDDKIMAAGLAENPITLGDGEYFVMGDNVNNSEDSRYVNVGTVLSSEIKGKVFYRISPAGSRGKIE